MAKSVAVWGIDIGRCALKALRCHLDGDSVVADGFDYIEYPKLLTQPEADAPQLIKEALEQFLSRNVVKGDKVSISVSGESGLARYFKPPPVDVKKIGDIVKYEARQQIPFALEDVIWDYQRMAGGQEVDGFALDTEIGLFAMKREAVQKAMTPYNTANIEVDIIQLAPIAIYNYIAHDVAKMLPEGEEYSSESPPPSLVVLSIGTDTTDLVVTNGYRVWQRNIPLGGNHFTRQLSKELKLTFAKAEHVKRNPKQAEDPKAIFQAMRPVFADMVTEVQRSIGFFQSLDRKAKINSVVTLGNTVKLPGLIQYLSKHLGYDVQEIESFNRLGGASVVTAPSFKDNLLAFSTCYGLCVQGLGKAKLSTNLLPREILTQRLIRAKKPWAIAGVSAMVLACALNYAFWYNRWWEVNPKRVVGTTTWEQALGQQASVSSVSSNFVTADKTKLDNLAVMKKIGTEVVGSSDRRVLWLEVMKALNATLPPMAPKLDPRAPTPDPKTLPFDKRNDLKIEYVETEFFQDLSTWFNDTVKEQYVFLNPELKTASADGGAAAGGPPPDPGATAAAAPAAVASPDAGAPPPGGIGGMGGDASMMPVGPQTDLSGVNVTPPTGPGWVVELKGHHFHNDPKDRVNTGALYVKNTMLRQLKEGEVELPLGPGKPAARFKMKDLGIGYAILAYSSKPRQVQIPNPDFAMKAAANTPAGSMPGAGPGIPGAGLMPPSLGVGVLPSLAAGMDPSLMQKEDPNNPWNYPAIVYEFAVQFVWQEKPLNIRLEEIKKAKEAAEAEAKAKADAAAAAAAGDGAAGAVPGAPQGAPGALPPSAAPAQPGQVAPAQQPVAAPEAATPDAGQPGAIPPQNGVPPQPGGGVVPQQPGVQPALPSVPTIPEVPPM